VHAVAAVAFVAADFGASCFCAVKRGPVASVLCAVERDESFFSVAEADLAAGAVLGNGHGSHNLRE
jgi:hypothetical protein